MLGLHHSLSFEYKDNVDLELNFRNKCREMGQEVFLRLTWQGGKVITIGSILKPYPSVGNLQIIC